MSTRNVVVFGGTGHQGSAFVRALSEQNKPHQAPIYTIYVLSRDVTQPATLRLELLPGVKIVDGGAFYMDQPDQSFEACGLQNGDIYGVFSVQGYMDNDKEISMGVRIAQSAAAYGAKNFVYASVAFDDTVQSAQDGLDPKRAVERAVKATTMNWTMLKATDFMDNWLPNEGTVGRVWRTILLRRTFKKHPDRKIAMVATRDIGRAGALAMTQPEVYGGKSLQLVGDMKSTKEILEIYKEVMGGAPTEAWGITISMAFYFEPNTALLAKYYDSDEYENVQFNTPKELLPEMEDFRTFLERFKREQAVEKALNK